MLIERELCRQTSVTYMNPVDMEFRAVYEIVGKIWVLQNATNLRLTAPDLRIRSYSS